MNHQTPAVFTLLHSVCEKLLVNQQTTHCCMQVDCSASAINSNDQTAPTLVNLMS